jgi:simple sugar transport system permease protein
MENQVNTLKTNRIKSLFSKTQMYILLIVIGYFVFVSISNPAFLKPENLLEIIRASSWMWILGMAVLLVMIAGGLDLSFASIAVSATYITAMTMVNNGIDDLAFAFLFAMLTGGLFGALNGVIIHFFKLPTFIVTLGTKTVFIGVMAALVGVSSLNLDHCPKTVQDFGIARLFTLETESGTTYGLTTFVVPLIIAVVFVWFLLYRTRMGRSIFAIGNSQEAARRAGYNLFATNMFIYIVVGVISAVAGVMAWAEVGWISPTSSRLVLGTDMNIIAAVIIGGAKLSGGEGTISGALLGILLIRLFETTLVFIGLTASWNDFFTGLAMLVCMSVTALQSYHKKRKLLLFEG